MRARVDWARIASPVFRIPFAIRDNQNNRWLDTLSVAIFPGPGPFLAQNYPNPFNPDTRIVYRLPLAGNVSLKIFDLLGQEVITLVNANMAPGDYEETWRGRNRAGIPVASGVHVYRLEIKDSQDEAVSLFVQTRKMILLR